MYLYKILIVFLDFSKYININPLNLIHYYTNMLYEYISYKTLYLYDEFITKTNYFIEESDLHNNLTLNIMLKVEKLYFF